MKNNSQKGIVKLAVLIIVVIIILSYLGINIQKIAESDAGKANFGYVWKLLSQAWSWIVGVYNQNLAEPIGRAWETIFRGQSLPNWLSDFKIPFLK